MTDTSYYAILPAPVRYDDDLPLAAKMLYTELTSCLNIDGYCVVNNKYLAQICVVSERRVKQYLEQLETKGYIKINTTETQRQIYLLVL